RALPTMLRYETHANSGSMYNTPPVFPIYVSMLTLRWLKQLGGLSAIAAINERKAQMLYEVIDEVPGYIGHAVPADRSRMNVTFNLAEKSLEQELFAFCRVAACDAV